MKILKTVLSTAIFFFTITGFVVYTSCEKDPCTDVSCKNGGSCNGGACICPADWEGPTCSDMVINRFIGYYAGFTGCNEGAQVIDTVFVSGGIAKQNLTVRIVQKTNKKDTLFGTVSSNESTYSITIPQKLTATYYKYYHITLQSDKKLTMFTYEKDFTNPDDTVINQCNFVGEKQKLPF